MIWAGIAAAVLGTGAVVGLLAVVARMPPTGQNRSNDGEGGDFFDMDSDSSDGSDGGGDGGGGGD